MLIDGARSVIEKYHVGFMSKDSSKKKNLTATFGPDTELTNS